MNQTAKTYPFDRSVMLNVIYDTLERLGIEVKSSNSERGRIQLGAAGAEYIVRIDTLYPGQTVRITTDSDEEENSGFSEALIDEISSTISVIKPTAPTV